MEKLFCTGFGPADILLPKKEYESVWSVVACDQYTSEPEYWEETQRIVGDAPSTLKLIFPEIYLGEQGFEERITHIHATMEEYLSQGVFRTLENALILVRRTQADGKVRTGLVGAVDLECYDYAKGSVSPIRATEGTVLERIPPRVKIRNGAALELPHIMLLTDDPNQTVIEPLSEQRDEFEKLYDIPLMQNGGRVEGWLVPESEHGKVAAALSALADGKAFAARYKKPESECLVYAVGDGNHSLATAKACYEQLKQSAGEDAAKASPARYALVELVNLHDKALEFEAIHRVVFGVEPENLLGALCQRYNVAERAVEGGQSFTYLYGDKKGVLTVLNPEANLTIGTLQRFLDEYCAEHGGETDYIHGADVVEKLSKKPNTIGFLLPDMGKSELFPTVIFDSALPRKTFSMGHAWDKRYYLEARKIR